MALCLALANLVMAYSLQIKSFNSIIVKAPAAVSSIDVGQHHFTVFSKELDNLTRRIFKPLFVVILPRLFFKNETFAQPTAQPDLMSVILAVP